MVNNFLEPDFSQGELELRFEDGVVCIYGTEQGLQKLADLCMSLVEHPNAPHIHIEDSRILTLASKKGAISIFPKSRKLRRQGFK